MKTKQPKKAKDLPPPHQDVYSFAHTSGYRAYNAAIIPCRSQAAAKKLVKLFNMSDEERVKIVADCIEATHRDSFREYARAVLSAIGLIGGGK